MIFSLTLSHFVVVVVCLCFFFVLCHCFTYSLSLPWCVPSRSCSTISIYKHSLALLLSISIVCFEVFHNVLGDTSIRYGFAWDLCLEWKREGETWSETESMKDVENGKQEENSMGTIFNRLQFKNVIIAYMCTSFSFAVSMCKVYANVCVTVGGVYFSPFVAARWYHLTPWISIYLTITHTHTLSITQIIIIISRSSNTQTLWAWRQCLFLCHLLFISLRWIGYSSVFNFT